MDDSRGKAGDSYEFAGFRLDEGERLLTRDGAPLPIPPKAFDVLLLLVSRAGRLVERDELLRTIWPGVHVTEGSLHQKISLLRRELGDEREPWRFIETIPKSGYRFVASVMVVTVEPGPARESVPSVPPAGRRWGTAVAGVSLLAVVGFLLAFRTAGPAAPDGATRDPEARREYLRARFFWNKRSPDDLLKAAENYEAAVRHDPRFAAAWAGLADTRVLQAVMGNAAAADARTAVARALEIDASLGAAHGTLAFEKFFLEWDMPGAGREYARAIDLAPEDATIRQRHAFYLVATGKSDDAVAEIRRARDLDPASLSINHDVGEILFWAHRYGEAILEFRRCLEMEASPRWHGQLALAYLYSGRLEEAREEIRLKELPAPLDAIYRVHVLEAEGRPDEARRALAEVERDQAYVAAHAESLAGAHAAVGDTDEALAFLEKAYAEHNVGLVFLNATPGYGRLKCEPRFQDLLRRIGLV